MALPQRPRQPRSNKRPPSTPALQQSQQQPIFELVESAHYRLEPFASLPSNVSEALARSPAALGTARVDEDWVFIVVGRFVLVWRLAEARARPVPAISRELPPSSVPITSRNLAFLRAGNVSRGLVVVTAEGHVRLWQDVESNAMHEATVPLDAQAHVSSLTSRAEAHTAVVGCSTGAVFILQAQAFIQISALTRPKSMLAGIGSLLGWGRGQAQPAAANPISALLTQHADLFVLTSVVLQRWQGATLLFEYNLQQAVEVALTEETLREIRESFDSEERVSHKVWLLQLAPGVPKESVHVLVASINALCPSDRLPVLSFAIVTVDITALPSITAIYPVQPTESALIYDRRQEAELLASVDLVSAAHGTTALLTHSRVTLFPIAAPVRDFDIFGAQRADDMPLGGGPVGQCLALISARGVRLAASKAAPPAASAVRRLCSDLQHLIPPLSSFHNLSPSITMRRYAVLGAALDAALSGSPAIYDGPVLEADLIAEVIARVATESSGAHEPSLLIRQQLEEKRGKYNAMLSLLTESLTWRMLSPAGARQLLDIGEQLEAAIGLRMLQNNSTAKADDNVKYDNTFSFVTYLSNQSELLLRAMQHSEDLFYSEHRLIGDLFDSVAAVCANIALTPRDSIDFARTLRAALSVLQALLGCARKFRENPRNAAAYETAERASGWLWRDAVREHTKQIVLMGLDRFSDVSRPPSVHGQTADPSILNLAHDLADYAKDVIDFTLAFYKDQVAADPNAEQLGNKWVDERFLMIQPFIERGLLERARELAEKYTDFECLIALSIDPQAPSLGPASPTLFEYADKYKDQGFVNYLLNHLLRAKRPADVLLVGFRYSEIFALWLKDGHRRPEDSTLVSRISWLHAWQQGEFGRGAQELSQLAAAEEMQHNKGTLLRKKTLASLALLSAIASGDPLAKDTAEKHVDLVARQEKFLKRAPEAVPLTAADLIATLIESSGEPAPRSERLRIAAEAFSRHCTLSSNQFLWISLWTAVLNDPRLSWAAVDSQYKSGASDANFEAVVKESAFFQILREDFVREKRLLEQEQFDKLLALRAPEERHALRRTYQLAFNVAERKRDGMVQ